MEDAENKFVGVAPTRVGLTKERELTIFDRDDLWSGGEFLNVTPYLLQEPRIKPIMEDLRSRVSPGANIGVGLVLLSRDGDREVVIGDSREIVPDYRRVCRGQENDQETREIDRVGSLGRDNPDIPEVTYRRLYRMMKDRLIFADSETKRMVTPALVFYDLGAKGLVKTSQGDYSLPIEAGDREKSIVAVYPVNVENYLPLTMGVGVITEVERLRKLRQDLRTGWWIAGEEGELEKELVFLEGVFLRSEYLPVLETVISTIKTGRFPEIKKELQLFLLRNVDAIVQKFFIDEKDSNGEGQNSVMGWKVLESLLDGNREDQKWVVSLIDKAIDVRKIDFSEMNDGSKMGAFKLIELKLEGAKTIQDRNSYLGAFRECLLLMPESDIYGLISSLFESKDGKKLEELNLLIEIFGFDKRTVKIIRNSWNSVHEDIKKGLDVFKQNYEIMLGCERKRPGSVVELNRRFKIAHFGRYPTELLVRQFDERDDNSKPYGIVVGCQDDWNGAFYSDVFNYESILGQMSKLGYSFRVCEAGNGLGTVRRIIEMDKRYGSNHKIELLIIAGHGRPDSVLFGLGENGGLSINDLLGRTTKKLVDKGVYSPSMQTVFWSCSTGVEGGIAQVSAEVMGGESVGPDKKAGALRHLIYIDQGKLRARVTYRSGASEKRYRGEK